MEEKDFQEKIKKVTNQLTEVFERTFAYVDEFVIEYEGKDDGEYSPYFLEGEGFLFNVIVDGYNYTCVVDKDFKQAFWDKRLQEKTYSNEVKQTTSKTPPKQSTNKPTKKLNEENVNVEVIDIEVTEVGFIDTSVNIKYRITDKETGKVLYEDWDRVTDYVMPGFDSSEEWDYFLDAKIENEELTPILDEDGEIDYDMDKYPKEIIDEFNEYIKGYYYDSYMCIDESLTDYIKVWEGSFAQRYKDTTVADEVLSMQDDYYVIDEDKTTD